MNDEVLDRIVGMLDRLPCGADMHVLRIGSFEDVATWLEKYVEALRIVTDSYEADRQELHRLHADLAAVGRVARLVSGRPAEYLTAGR